MVSSNRKSVAVTTEHEDVQVGAGEGNSGSKRKGTTVNEVDAVGVHEVWESRRATDAGDNADFFVGNAELLDNIEE